MSLGAVGLWRAAAAPGRGPPGDEGARRGAGLQSDGDRVFGGELVGAGPSGGHKCSVGLQGLLHAGIKRLLTSLAFMGSPTWEEYEGGDRALQSIKSSTPRPPCNPPPRARDGLPGGGGGGETVTK